MCVCLPLHNSPATFSRIKTIHFLYIGSLFADVKGYFLGDVKFYHEFYVLKVLNVFNYWKLKYVPSSNTRYSKIKVSIKRQFCQIYFSLVKTLLPPHALILIIFSMMISMLFFLKHCMNLFFKRRLYSFFKTPI